MIAKRSVEPLFVNSGYLDTGGGEAALDSESWVHCQNTAADSFRCANTMQLSHANGARVPASPAHEDPWTTTHDQTDAMKKP